LPSSTLFAVNVVAPVPPFATGNVPETSDASATVPAVIDEVPLPLTTPVNVVAPVPPLPTGNVPVIPPEILIPPVADNVPATVTFAPLVVSAVTPFDWS
jgi:hypothetical protein